MAIIVSAIGALFLGWYLHTLYLRAMYDVQLKARRAMRGGARRRRH